MFRIKREDWKIKFIFQKITDVHLVACLASIQPLLSNHGNILDPTALNRKGSMPAPSLNKERRAGLSEFRVSPSSISLKP